MPTNSKDFSTKNGIDVNSSFITNSDIYLDSDAYVSMFSSNGSKYTLSVEDDGSLSTNFIIPVIGDVGPGGGLIFYDAGSTQPWGRFLEMAPKTWSGGASDPSATWCNLTNSTISGTFGVAIGTGAQNTVLIDAGCTGGAGQLVSDAAYGGFTDWFLPSQDEANAMRLYRNSIIDTAKYGLDGYYWTSSQCASWCAIYYHATNNLITTTDKHLNAQVRPIRAF